MNIPSDPFSLTGISIGVLTVIWFFVRHISGKFIEKQFQKNIETYKNELQGVLESKKFDFQRMMHDFNLYRSKKHEIYPELFRFLLKATIGLNNLKNNWDFPYFRSLGKEFVVQYLLEKGVGQTEIDYITDHWLDDDEEKIQDIKYAIKKLERESVKNEYKIFHNYFLEVELYLSDEIVKVIQEILQDFDEILENMIYDLLKIRHKLDEIINYNPRTETGILYNRIFENVDKLKKQLKNELSVAEY
ncbi:hypothetical protein [Paenibacillus alvei]|uniref:Uncharacterized protein n=1 Tax=Paenibacillus alvei TaxID=44250 RepID=A0AAP7A0M9_PAEAL|nr:hypothetical protein [Paenibacillus alvei]NOJ73181.1 hypothetical protein [Paenibacillus alvei]